LMKSFCPTYNAGRLCITSPRLQNIISKPQNASLPCEATTIP
jgi:hypothetical protein